MYPRNAANPPPIYAKLASLSGSPIVEGVSVYHVVGNQQQEAAGVIGHVSDGLWVYKPTRAETNYDTFAIHFRHSNAVGGGVQVQVVTSTADEQFAEILEGLSGVPAAVWDYMLQNQSETVGQIIVRLLERVVGLGGVVSVVSPVSPDGQDIWLIRGDDHTVTTKRALRWRSLSWPDLTDATVTLTLKLIEGEDIRTKQATVLSAGTGLQEIQVELTRDDTGDMDIGCHNYQYAIRATLQTREVCTLVRGRCSVVAPV